MSNVAEIAGVKFEMATAKLLEGVVADPAAEVVADLAALRAGTHTAESLLAHCLDGADDEDADTWRDYVATVVDAFEGTRASAPEGRGGVVIRYYVPCALDSIPDGVTFSVPRQNQGQIVEVAYGDFGRDEACAGDPYKRVIDRSEPGHPAKYYRRTLSRYGFEVLMGGQWSAEACGVQDVSNLFASREEAEQELPRLAAALECSTDELRVVEVQS